MESGGPVPVQIMVLCGPNHARVKLMIIHTRKEKNHIAVGVVPPGLEVAATLEIKNDISALDSIEVLRVPEPEGALRIVISG